MSACSTSSQTYVSDDGQLSATNNSINVSTLPLVSDIANIWLLPDGVTDLLSNEAQKQEKLRYELTKRLVGRGYELLCPPMIEYTESLLNNASEDLKRQTFKIIDQATGRLMGVRADITPQILRIDAHLNQAYGVNHIARYCYAGHVIHTMPKGLFGSRTPLQLGAEIFGCEDIRADIELLDVLFDLLGSLDLKAKLHVDIGQVAIFKRLCQLAQLDKAEVLQLMSLYANKALPELARVCQNLPMGADFYALAKQGHNMDALLENLSKSACQDSIIIEAMREVSQIKQHLEQRWQCHVSMDITELTGYYYHTGLVFNVYVNNESQAVARGGRFDGMVITHPQAGLSSKRCHQENSSELTQSTQTNNRRFATGFSLDLTRLQSHIDLANQALVVVDYASCQNLSSSEQANLDNKVEQLRKAGYRVILPLSIDDSTEKMSLRLYLVDKQWQLQSVQK